MRHDERRARVDDNDDGRARRGGADDARQARVDPLRLDLARPRLDVLGLEIDLEHAVDGRDASDHRRRSLSATSDASTNERAKLGSEAPVPAGSACASRSVHALGPVGWSHW